MFKKIFIIMFTSLLLFSCWSDTIETNKNMEENTETTQKTWLRNYPWEDFSIKIPAAWNVITDKKDVVPNPNNGELELAITSSETKNGFANNLIILSQELESFTTSKDYSITNNVWAENEYINYFKHSAKEFTFEDWEKSMLYIFDAKYSVETPTIKFLQTAYVCKNKKAFFITVAIPVDVVDTTKYEKMIATFKCS